MHLCRKKLNLDTHLTKETPHSCILKIKLLLSLSGEDIWYIKCTYLLIMTIIIKKRSDEKIETPSDKDLNFIFSYKIYFYNNLLLKDESKKIKSFQRDTEIFLERKLLFPFFFCLIKILLTNITLKNFVNNNISRLLLL